MPTRRFEQITLDQILLSGCAIVFGACILIQHAQAQPGYVPPPTPPPSSYVPSDESLAVFATSRPKRGLLLKQLRAQTRLDATQFFA